MTYKWVKEVMTNMVGYVGGPLFIDNIGGSSIVNFGGSVFVSPKNISKTAYGASSGNTAALNFNVTGPSSTNTGIFDLFDQPIAGNT